MRVSQHGMQIAHARATGYRYAGPGAAPTRRDARRLPRARECHAATSAMAPRLLDVLVCHLYDQESLLKSHRPLDATAPLQAVTEDRDDGTSISPRQATPLVPTIPASRRRKKRRRDVVVAPNAVGSVLGNYRILRCIAGGGNGWVYEAKHLYLGRHVAIKIQHRRHRSDPKQRMRLLGEAVSAQKIKHPGIVRVFDYGQDKDGTAFLIMEYLDGHTLAARLEQDSRLPLPRALEIARQIATIMTSVHAAGIIHRDLKPDNIHLLPDSRVKLLDFGVAKFTGNKLISSMHTALGDVLGTPAYMSPEQCQSSSGVDHRSDIYGLGCVLYRMLCGRDPFMGSIGDILTGHVGESPIPPSRLDPTFWPTGWPSIPPAVATALESLVLSMLAKNPDHRPQSMTRVAEALAGIAAELSSVSAATDHPAQPKIGEPRNLPRQPPEVEVIRRFKPRVPHLLALVLAMLL